MADMRAVVIYEAGGPEVLKLETRPAPEPKAGEVLIRVRAFGIDRSEMFTRQGKSPNVKFPRILGIEATGTVEAAPGGEFAPGDKVATAMGGLGRDIDGGYAEFTLVPAAHVQKLDTDLDWATIGAMPEMLQTAWGSLFRSLQLKSGDTLLVRGGTTSVGLAAAAIAKKHGAHVLSTSRHAESEALLRSSGTDEFVLDDGNVAARLGSRKVDKVLELIGTSTLLDSLRCVSDGGIVCMTGIVGNKWTLDGFNPMERIPTAAYLTSYAGENADFLRTPLTELAAQIKAGELKLEVGKTFTLDQIVEAHQMMDSNKAGGKIVVLVP